MKEEAAKTDAKVAEKSGRGEGAPAEKKAAAPLKRRLPQRKRPLRRKRRRRKPLRKHCCKEDFNQEGRREGRACQRKAAAAVEAAPAAKEEKKPAKAPAKRGPRKAAEAKSNVTVQFAGKSYSTEDLVKIAKDVWKYDLGRDEADFKSVELYVKPEESSVYYVVNGDVTGSFNI